MTRLLLLPLILLIGLLVLVTVDQGDRDAELVFAADNEVFTLDPQRMSWLGDMRMAYALYEGLVRWNPDDFSTQAAVARSWSVSDDNLTWTFEMDPEAQWSDGSPVTAHDFAWSWQRLLMPDTAADYSNLLFAIDGAQEFLRWRADALANFTPSDDAAETLLAATDHQFQKTVGIQAVGEHTLELQIGRAHV